MLPTYLSVSSSDLVMSPLPYLPKFNRNLNNLVAASGTETARSFCFFLPWGTTLVQWVGGIHVRHHDSVSDPGTVVPTGITTEMIILDTLTFELSTQCPACRKTHKWKRRDAWIDGERKLRTN
jgi:hypothetical protein